MSIEIIFTCFNITKSVAEFTGLIESLDAKIDKLSQSEFNAGINSLEQAIHSNSETVHLLREARSFFNKAVGLEKNMRLILSYLGLSLCHYHLNDIENCKASLLKATKVKPSVEAGEIKDIAINVIIPGFAVRGAIKTIEVLLKRASMEDVQAQIKEFLKQL